MNINEVPLRSVHRDDCWRCIEIDDAVFQSWQGIRRYGVVYQKRSGSDGWVYLKIDWFNDDAYLTAISELKRFRNTDDYRHEYRCDEVKVIDIKKEIKTLQKCLEHVELESK